MPSMTAPVWQNGTPQSMHRAPCWRSNLSSAWPWNSLHTRLRSIGESAMGSSRGNSMNPVGLPISLPSHASQVVRILLERRHDRLALRETFLLVALLRLEYPPVVVWVHLDEL